MKFISIIVLTVFVNISLSSSIFCEMSAHNEHASAENQQAGDEHVNHDHSVLTSPEPMPDNQDSQHEIPMISMNQGVAYLKGTKPGSAITGTIKFMESDAGLIVEVEIKNVPSSGKHGFHIHENGSCADEGKAAGGHYNPANAPHGFLETNGHQHAHVGDMGNVEIDESGTGKYSGILPAIGLTTGLYQVAGHAVILHEKEDDFSQPTGNAGGRIACGIIELIK